MIQLEDLIHEDDSHMLLHNDSKVKETSPLELKEINDHHPAEHIDDPFLDHPQHLPSSSAHLTFYSSEEPNFNYESQL